MTDQQLKPRVCARDGCGRPATTMVRLRLRPPREMGDHEIEAFIDLVLCEDHGATASAAEVITDDGWANICAALARIGIHPPDRGRTAVDAIPIDRAPPHLRARYAAADA